VTNQPPRLRSPEVDRASLGPSEPRDAQRRAAPSGPVTQVEGRGLPLRGDDIDTDRIMPARFLKAVSFDGLDRHLFEDDRSANAQHPFNDPRFAGASILIVNANFGCGSSREHAPQGIVRAGFRALVGESFSEIFQGNAAMLGMPCFVADRAAIEQLQAAIEAAPDTIVSADVASGVVTAGTVRVSASVPPALRDGFLSGQWNPTAMLLDRFEEVRAVAARLPYIRGF
jgi:3-isopropylmalate/(R)-2-methylmalate dehydratase small subunit